MGMTGFMMFKSWHDKGEGMMSIMMLIMIL